MGRIYRITDKKMEAAIWRGDLGGCSRYPLGNLFSVHVGLSRNIFSI